MTEFMAEVIGTMILIIFGAGVVAGVVLKDSKAENSGWVVIMPGCLLSDRFSAASTERFSIKPYLQMNTDCRFGY